jgi:hypothetical protein
MGAKNLKFEKKKFILMGTKIEICEKKNFYDLFIF